MTTSSTEPTRSRLLLLPPELQLKIFRLVCSSDLSQIWPYGTKVNSVANLPYIALCKQLQPIIQQAAYTNIVHPLPWLDEDHEDYGDMKPYSKLEELLQLCRAQVWPGTCIRHLSFQTPQMLPHMSMYEEDVAEENKFVLHCLSIAAICRALDSFKLTTRNAKEWAMDALLEGIPTTHLQHFSIDSPVTSYDGPALSVASLCTFLQAAHQLQTLCFGFCNFVDGFASSALKAKSKNLDISFLHCDFGRSFYARRIGSMVTNSWTSGSIGWFLDRRDLLTNPPQELDDLLSYAQNLQHLTIRDTVPCGMMILTTILTPTYHLPNLKNCSRLKHLDIATSVSDITEETWLALPPQLESLSVSGHVLKMPALNKLEGLLSNMQAWMSSLKRLRLLQHHPADFGKKEVPAAVAAKLTTAAKLKSLEERSRVVELMDF